MLQQLIQVDRYKLFEIADQSGTYVKNMGRYMLKPTYVAEQIVKSMHTKKREVNLPKWMGIGPKLYALFPGLFERVAGKSLSKNRRFPYGNLLFLLFSVT